MKITADLTGNETAIVRQARLKSVYDWYKGDGAYVAAGNLGVVRAAINDYLVNDIANLESFASWLLKFNLLNSPDTLIRSQLFTGGAKGVWFDPNDLPTLTQDAAGTTPVTTAGQPVGRALDKSGNAAHATQAVTSKRPIYGVIPKGGIRNQAMGAQGVNIITNWNDSSLSNGLTFTKVGTGIEDGVDYVDIRAVGTVTAGEHHIGWNLNNSFIPISSGKCVAKYTARVIAGSPVSKGLGMKLTEKNAAKATLTPGAKTATFANTFTDSDVMLSKEAVTPGVAYIGMEFLLETTVAEVVDVTYRIKKFQFELGETPTALQRNLGPYDITETGVPSLQYLASDLIDDELPATVPSLGSNATVWFAVDGASTILTGQTVAAGPIAALRGARTYAMGAIDRPLSAGETAALTLYLNKARGAL